MPAQVGTNVRSVTHNRLGAVAVKSRAHQVGMPRRAGVDLGGADPFAAADSGDPGGPHQPGDLVTTDVVAGASCCFPQLAGTVDPVVVLP